MVKALVSKTGNCGFESHCNKDLSIFVLLIWKRLKVAILTSLLKRQAEQSALRVRRSPLPLGDIMSKTTFYRHCRLQNGNTQTISWIPDKFAKVGWKLNLRDKHGEWSGFVWDVISASEPMDGKLVENQAHNSNNIWEPSANLTSRGKK
jgi:hypothetical protein